MSLLAAVVRAILPVPRADAQHYGLPYLCGLPYIRATRDPHILPASGLPWPFPGRPAFCALLPRFFSVICRQDHSTFYQEVAGDRQQSEF